MRKLKLLLFVGLVASCGSGDLDIKTGANNATPGDDMVGSTPNNGTMPDMGVPPTRDMSPNNLPLPDMDDNNVPGEDMDTPDMRPPMCDPADCGPGASCQNNVCTCDDGLLGDPLVGCSVVDPCENVSCAAGASCNPDGSCSCDPFFSGDPTTGCDPTVPAADLSARSAADVCAIWTDQYQRSSPDFWMIEPDANDACDPGRLHPEELRNALHRTSQYRMLVGLHPVSLAAGSIETTQDCAMMHDANNSGGLSLDHNPPQSWNCYTQAGANGCGSSNLAGGINQPAGTVGLYVADNNVPSLGHRRWVFNPRMGQTAFGHKGRFGAMYAFDGSRNHNVAYVAYPAPGPFPRGAISGKWSIHGGASYQADFDVEITNLGDMSDVPVSNITAPVFGNLASTLAWDVNTNSLPVDTTYRITIRDGGGAMVQQYETTLVDCP